LLIKSEAVVVTASRKVEANDGFSPSVRNQSADIASPCLKKEKAKQSK
jgi:hypothetical protein